MFETDYPQFTTVTCLNWKPLIKGEREKYIITDCFRFLVNQNRVIIFAFVILDNHLHLIWQMKAGYRRELEQANLLKFTAKQILKNFTDDRSTILDGLMVKAADRKFQIWERNSMSIPLWSDKFFDQKLEYIHMNPVTAGICIQPEDYKFSSASFYINNETCWDFLTHLDG